MRPFWLGSLERCYQLDEGETLSQIVVFCFCCDASTSFPVHQNTIEYRVKAVVDHEIK